MTIPSPSPACVADIPNSDSESFNPALWEEQRKHRAQVAFECDEDKDEREAPPRVRCVLPKNPLPRSSHLMNVSNERVSSLPGGQPEALSHAVSRRAEEHGEDGPVSGAPAQGGRVERRVGERPKATRGEEPRWRAGRGSQGLVNCSFCLASAT